MWANCGVSVPLNISFVMSVRVSLCVRPSSHLEQLGSQSTDFHEIWYLSIFRKSVEKNSIFIKI
jgi:hypothetical protein